MKLAAQGFIVGDFISIVAASGEHERLDDGDDDGDGHGGGEGLSKWVMNWPSRGLDEVEAAVWRCSCGGTWWLACEGEDDAPVEGSVSEDGGRESAIIWSDGSDCSEAMLASYMVLRAEYSKMAPRGWARSSERVGQVAGWRWDEEISQHFDIRRSEQE